MANEEVKNNEDNDKEVKKEQEFKSVLYCMRKEYIAPYNKYSDMRKIKSKEETEKYWEEERKKEELEKKKKEKKDADLER